MFFSIVSNQAELVEDKFRIINLGLWQPISGHRRAELMMSPNKWRECGMNRAGITQAQGDNTLSNYLVLTFFNTFTIGSLVSLAPQYPFKSAQISL